MSRADHCSSKLSKRQPLSYLNILECLKKIEGKLMQDLAFRFSNQNKK